MSEGEITRDASRRMIVDPSSDLSVESERMKSFTHWSKWCSYKPESLANAGFYYESIKDELKCFSCSATVERLYEADNVWLNHDASCDHAKFVKGKDFLNKNEDAAHSSCENNDPSENKSLICVCCMDSEVSIVLSPCKHVVLCGKCCLSLSKCPKCRSEIVRREKVFF